MNQPDDDKTREVTVLSKGTVINHYRIIEKIGAGGMGEVYLAEDTSLNRQIAIKVLPDTFGTDPERLARFDREAKLLASLNHPNLATIHGLESAAGKPFLIMEFVAGETLAQRIAKGPLPVEEALEVCRQIAEGMEAAHEKGIIHRDLKPANIKITPEGKVKILDFGLAKAIHEDLPAADAAQSPTVTEQMTRAGVILGTAAYMSPEQAKGKPVDKRADIWAFGCILFECLTGRRAFEGETVSETLAAILRGEPNWDKLPAQTPLHIKALLHRCLHKNSTQRLRDIGDARIEVEGFSFDTIATSEMRGRSWREIFAWAIAALAVVAVAILWISSGGRQSAREEPIISHILPPENSVSCFRDGFALSPDGRKLAFVSLSSKGERLVWVRFLDRQDAVPLTGTDNASYPFWSPNSKEIAFYSGGKLKRVSADGGLIQEVCRANLVGAHGGSWGSAGVILFRDDIGGTSRVSEAGGESVQVIMERSLVFASFVSDGQRFLHIGSSGGKNGVFVASLTKPDSGREILGTSDAGRVEWVPPDRLVLWRSSDRTLVTQRVNLGSGSTLGPQKLLAERVPCPNDWPMFSTSPADMMAFVVNPSQARNDFASRLVWVDRKGNVLGNLGDIGGYWDLRISLDGRRVAVNPDNDVWIFDIATGLPTRLTNEMASGSGADTPLWSPRGDRIVAMTSDRAQSAITEYPISGGHPRVIYRDSSSSPYATDWSRDGRYLAIDRYEFRGNLTDMMYFDFADNQLKPFLATLSDEGDGHFSPDGRWIAYVSNETGSYEVYIRSFPGGDQFRRISFAGGMHPRWRADGRELFFLAPGWKVMATEMKLQPTLEIGTPTPLFQMVMADIMKGYTAPYDVSPDGQRFLVISPQTKPVPLTLVQNWTALADR